MLPGMRFGNAVEEIAQRRSVPRLTAVGAIQLIEKSFRIPHVYLLTT